ncbi:MAG: TRAP transporter small permease [Clostridiales Family XIII bacterium]|jgi:TRAP-type C4-dicarboxylate transport system permease small subunit|nr:TRAP transporter small permease [Clostridiales Family XIII bacterium]
MAVDTHKSITLGRAVNGAFKTLEIIISVFLAAMIVFTFINVLIRYCSRIPGAADISAISALVSMTGVNAEIARIMFIYLVYLGSIIAARDNKHLMIDTLIMKVPTTARKILYAVIQLLIIFLTGWLAKGAWDIALRNINDFWVATHFPVFVLHFSGVILGVAYMLICAANLVRLFVYKESVEKLLTDASGADDGLREGGGMQ